MQNQPIAVQFDIDCDGTGVGVWDTEHPNFPGQLSYDVPVDQADGHLTREQFDRVVWPLLGKHGRSYWRREGYANGFNDPVVAALRREGDR
jgi:hypothetical protein